MSSTARSKSKSKGKRGATKAQSGPLLGSRSLHMLRLGRCDVLPLLLKLHSPSSFDALRFQVLLSTLHPFVKANLMPNPVTGQPLLVPQATEEAPILFKDEEANFAMYYIPAEPKLSFLQSPQPSDSKPPDSTPSSHVNSAGSSRSNYMDIDGEEDPELLVVRDKVEVKVKGEESTSSKRGALGFDVEVIGGDDEEEEERARKRKRESADWDPYGQLLPDSEEWRPLQRFHVADYYLVVRTFPLNEAYRNKTEMATNLISTYFGKPILTHSSSAASTPSASTTTTTATATAPTIDPATSTSTATTSPLVPPIVPGSSAQSTLMTDL